MVEVIAMLTMLTDHIGVAFFPQYEFMRIIGRIALPLYAYGIVRGYRYTGNKIRYAKRPFVIALISQPVYYLVFGNNQLNVVFGLLVGIMVLWVLDGIPSLTIKILVVLWAMMILVVLPIAYSAYSLLLILIYRYSKGMALLILHSLLNAGTVLLTSWPYPTFSILGSLLILFPCVNNRYMIYRRFYRYFYPIHLGLLFVVRQLVY